MRISGIRSVSGGRLSIDGVSPASQSTGNYIVSGARLSFRNHQSKNWILSSYITKRHFPSSQSSYIWEARKLITNIWKRNWNCESIADFFTDKIRIIREDITEKLKRCSNDKRRTLATSIHLNFWQLSPPLQRMRDRSLSNAPLQNRVNTKHLASTALQALCEGNLPVMVDSSNKGPVVQVSISWCNHV